MSKFNIAAKYNGWDRRDRAAFLKLSLVGQPAKLIRQLEDATYAEVLQKLKTHFGGSDLLKQHRLDLKTRKKKASESWNELAFEIERITSQAYLGLDDGQRDSIALDAFVDAIDKEKLRIKVMEKDPATLKEAAATVTRLDFLYNSVRERDQEDRPRRHVVRTAQTGPRQPELMRRQYHTKQPQQPIQKLPEERKDDQQQQIEELRRQMRQLTMTLSAPNAPVGTHPPSQYQSGQQPYRPRSYTPALPRRQDVPPLLPDRGRSGQQPTIEGCFLCGDPGHFKRDCPRNFNRRELPPSNKVYYSRRQPYEGRNEQRRDESQDRSGNQPPERVNRVAGSKTPGKAPAYLKIKIRHQPRLCLLDTGSDTTLVPLRMVGKYPIYKTRQVCVAANGTAIPIVGTTTIPGQIGTKNIKITGLVTNHINDMLLGMDWLQENQVSWDFNRAEVSIDGESFKLRLRKATSQYCRRIAVAEDVTIPPRSQCNTNTNVIIEDLAIDAEPYEGAWGTEPTEVQEGLLVARTILPDRLDNLPVQLLNLSTKPVELKKDTIISPLIPLTVAHVRTEEDLTVEKTSEELEEEIIQKMMSEVDPSITTDIKDSLRRLLKKYSSVLSLGEWDLGWTDIVRHSIDTENNQPFRQPMRRYPPAHLTAIDDHLKEMLQQGVIEPAISPWASNVVLAKKKDGTYRPCIDFRQLNTITKKDAYPLPRTDECLEALAGSTLFSTFDLRSGFHQVAMNEADSDKTAFITSRGMFKFKTMPFGLTNAVATFQRLMDLILTGLNLSICLAYLDDIVVFSKTPQEHLHRLECLLQRLQEANLKLKPPKCKLMQTSVVFLGHIVSEEGVQTDQEKTRLVNDWPAPRNIKELRGFLGLTGYYRRFVKDYAKIAEPLNKLLKKTQAFHWTPECQAAFDQLKQKLQEPPILTLPNETDRFILDTDASGESIGAVLSQVQGGHEKVIAYAGRTLTVNERNYCITRKELLAVVHYTKYFKQYLLGRTFTLRTDHAALSWIRRTPEPVGQNARWMEALEEYNFAIQHRPGERHRNADAMSRHPCLNRPNCTACHPQLREVELHRPAREEEEIVRICHTATDNNGVTAGEANVAITESQLQQPASLEQTAAQLPTIIEEEEPSEEETDKPLQKGDGPADSIVW